MQQQDQVLYRVSRTAEMLDVSRSTVYRLVRSKHLKLVKIGKRGSRISAESISEFLKLRSTPDPQ
ncbi:Helix-turn-helix domain protein [compost metagenome]